MPLSDAQWKALERDILDRRGLKHEWSAIDKDVKLEIRREWSAIIDGAAPQTPEEVTICSRCGRDVCKDRFYAMCDNAGVFCSDCWAVVADLCLMVHGEGCATKVFQDVKLEGEADVPTTTP